MARKGKKRKATVRAPEPAATGEGFEIFLDQDVTEVLRFARRLETGEILPIQPARRTIRGEVVAVYQARNGFLGLSLNRKWPAPGAIVVWLTPELARRIQLPSDQLKGLVVEVRGLWFSTDRGKTIQANISDPTDLRFVYPSLPTLP